MKIIETNFNIKVPRNNKPQYIIIHHALASNCTVYDIHNWHRGKGFWWAGIGYHYFIDKQGKVYRGRDENQRGAHCKQQGMNSKSIGICLEGCYQDYKGMCDIEVPQAQLDALVWLVKDIQDRYNIPIERVKKHHDYARYKLCPGDYFPWDRFISRLSDSGDLEKATLRIKQLEEQNATLTKELFNRDTKIQELTHKLTTIKPLLEDIERVIK